MTQTFIQQGDHYLDARKLEAAKQAYLSALQQEPNNALAYLGLGKLAQYIADYDRAITLLTEACKLPPHPQDALLLLSECFNTVSSPADALTALNFAHQHYPESKMILSALVQQHIRMGSWGLAEPLLQQQIASEDALFSAYGWLDTVRVWHTPLTSSQVQLIVESEKKVSGKANMLLNYALGQAYDRLGKFKQAAVHMKKANAYQLSLCDFDTQQIAPFYRSIIKCFQPNPPPSATNKQPDSLVPIFIVGLPRTGSTLLEQMLARHTQIDTVGEQSFLSDRCVPLLEKSSHQRFPVCVTHSQQNSKDMAATHYLSFLAKHTSAKYVINKLPANIQNIGVIFSLFANAKVIILSRDIKDVSLSVFKNHFAQNEPYFCDIKQFQQFSEYTQSLADHWRLVYGDRIMDIRYETLVREPHSALQNMFDYLGLPMELDCLDPEVSNNIVDTLSAIEVKKPISTAGIGRWRDYEGILFD